MILGASAFVLGDALGCTLTMGYRTNSRPPLIGKAPDNGGLYFDLYSEAVNRIVCQIKIVRKPKKRLLHLLETGEVDFYPGFNFTDERANYVFYIVNGLPGGDVGLSRVDIPDISHLSQLTGKKLIVPLGSPDWNAASYGMSVLKVSEMSVSRAIKMIQLKRADFFIYNRSSIEYALVNAQPGLKVHYDCCGGVKPLYLGFSRSSKHFSEVLNELYDSDMPNSPDNFSTKLTEDSKAYEFANALKDMAEEGFTLNLYESYY